MALERLDKLLASTGRWSRKEVKDLVRQGRVLVNGRPVLRSEEKWEPTETELTVDGQRVDCAPFVYLMLHKPAGLLSATEDRDQRTVLDLLPEHLRRRGLFPVGRLDKDTEGLLLLTDDGPLGHALLSPKRHVDKTYYARIQGRVKSEHVQAFLEGLDIGDEKKTLPAELRILKSGPESEIEVTIREGRFHQVKRMFEVIGCEVTYLKRLSMGSLKLDETLESGACRPLTEEELRKLKEETGCWTE